LKDFLRKFLLKGREPKIGADEQSMQHIHDALLLIREDLVKAFNFIKDRRLRELYTQYSYFMYRYDKILQRLRLTLDRDLYYKPRESDLEGVISKIRPDIAIALREIAYRVGNLVDLSRSGSPNQISFSLKELERTIDGLLATMLET